MVGIIDYGMGNLLSVYNAFDYLGEDVMICKEPKDLVHADKIVIPGVGAFKDCAALIKQPELLYELEKQVISNAKPTLGICLGMQVMAKKGYEFGEFEGLGWFDSEVKKIDVSNTDLKLPNIGWNEINQSFQHELFKGISNLSDFYLVHSFFMDCNETADVIANYQYGEKIITAAVLKNNIFATQFHPEKSQDNGLKLLENFINWNP
jgi:imidazole glycerol-phosphate synthase subunit HisH